MHRLLSALVQAVETCSILLIGLLLALVPTVIGLAVAGGFPGDLALAWRASVDIWLLGHGADVGVTLDDASVIRAGVEGAARPFVIGVPALGFALVTLALSARSGARLTAAPGSGWAFSGGVAAASALGAGLAATAQHALAAPNIAHAAVGPAAVVALGFLLGALPSLREKVPDVGGWLGVGERARDIIWSSLRGGVAVAVAVLGLGAVLLAVALIIRQGDVITLFELSQPTHLDATLIWLTQLALLPTAVIWSSAWMLGVGFQLGTGSSVSPIGTDLGPVPALPLVGAIDPDVASWSLAVLAAPIAAAVAIGWFLRQRHARLHAPWWEWLAIAAGSGVVAGGVVGALAAVASGGMGPGRLSEAGPTWWMVAASAAAITAVGVGVGAVIPQGGGGASAGDVSDPTGDDVAWRESDEGRGGTDDDRGGTDVGFFGSPAERGDEMWRRADPDDELDADTLDTADPEDAAATSDAIAEGDEDSDTKR